MINDIVMYKKSVALFAANKLKLFEYMSNDHYVDLTICEQNNWNKDALTLLCTFLEGEGYFERKNNKWYLSEKTKKQLSLSKIILENESMLYQKWINPDSITETICKKNDRKKSNKNSFHPEEQAIYNKLMYENNLHFIVFNLLRKIKSLHSINTKILEYGKSAGKISHLIKKHISESKTVFANFDTPLNMDNKFDIIVIYNSIHYQSSEKWIEIFNTLKRLLNDTGIICIIDFFYEKEDDFKSTLLIEWLSCGGIYNISYEETAQLLYSSGLNSLQKETLKGTSLDIIYACK